MTLWRVLEMECMNKDQFIYWLKGFARAVNEEGPTRGQWGIISSELDKIKDCPDFGSPIEEFKLNPMWQEPHYVNPWDKYKVTCEENPYKAGKTDTKVTYGSGTISGSGVIVTDGFIQNSSITRAQPPFTLTTTSTAYGHPSGSTVNYTANLPEDL
jgi:hypothetical protein